MFAHSESWVDEGSVPARADYSGGSPDSAAGADGTTGAGRFMTLDAGGGFLSRARFHITRA